MKRVYVTEDSPTQALRVGKILQLIPECEVHFFNDGLAAYQEVLLNPPDLLLLDLILPSLHGLAVARLLKYHEDYQHIPILIFSSITEQSLADSAGMSGANAFLRKPFEAEDLLYEVRRLLELPQEVAARQEG